MTMLPTAPLMPPPAMPPQPPSGLAGMGLPVPAPAPPPLPPAAIGDLKGMAQRRQAVLDGLRTTPKGAISAASQLQKYQQRTQDMAWVDKALNLMPNDPSAQFWLKAIKEHGWPGVAQYVDAMEQMQNGGVS